MTGWLQSAEDVARGQARVDVRTIQSPSGLASALFRRAGVAPLLAKYDVPSDAALDRWMSANFGGWQTAEWAGAGVFLAADIDEVSAYARNFGLVGGWAYCAAAELVEEDALADVLALVEQLARGDVCCLFEKATYGPGSLGCTLVEVRHGELPVEVDEPRHPEGGYRLRWVERDRPLFRSVYDVLLSAIRTGRADGIVSAVRLRPIGRQPGLRRRVPLYGGLVDLTDDDPVAALVRIRADAKAAGDDRLAGLLRVVTNALCYGNFGRLDQVATLSGRRFVTTERVADYTFPPLAVTVTAATRLLVGLAEHLATGGAR